MRGWGGVRRCEEGKEERGEVSRVEGVKGVRRGYEGVRMGWEGGEEGWGGVNMG